MCRARKGVYLHDEAAYKFVKEIMEQFLPLPEDGKDYTASEVYDVLLAAASQDTSIDNICHSSETGPSANTVRNRVREAYDLLAVEERMNQALAEQIPKKLLKRGQRIAIDLVLNPYYGKETQEKAAELIHGERRDGTTRFHAYASAYVILNGERFTVAVTFVWAEDRLPEVVQRLGQRLRQRGIKTKLLLLDRQFFTVEIIDLLQRQRQPFIIPVILRGKREPPGGTRRLGVKRSSHWTRYRMKSADGQTVTFEVAVGAQKWGLSPEPLRAAGEGGPSRPGLCHLWAEVASIGHCPDLSNAVRDRIVLSSDASGAGPHQFALSGVAVVVGGPKLLAAQPLDLDSLPGHGAAPSW